MQIRGSSEPTVFDLVGGQEWFDRLVEEFYRGVADDSRLRPMYPEDLTDSKRHLALFLGQYWGGPTTYMDERGHPRLRMRHVPFAIDEAAAEAWLEHMLAALDALGPPDAVDAAMRTYFDGAARFLVNHPG